MLSTNHEYVITSSYSIINVGQGGLFRSHQNDFALTRLGYFL
jgi:hypothetical protein